MTNWKKTLLAIQLSLVCIMASSMANAKPANKLQSLAELSNKAPITKHLNVQTWQTKAGSEVLFVEAHELPMFDIQITFAAGSSRDGKKPGVALLTNAMLNEGVQGKDVVAIAKTFESVGAIFGNGSYKDMAIVTLRSLTDAKKRQIALNMFTDVIGKPSFPDSSFDRIQNQMLTGFEIQKKTPSTLLSKTFYSKLYGQHPYAHPSDGNEKSIESLTLEDVKAFYQKAYTSKNAVIAIVGDLSKSEAMAMAEKMSDALPKGEKLKAIELPKPPKAGVYHIDFSSKQTHIILGQLGVDRKNPDFAALYLGSQILGGGNLSSRLMTEVRERRGLTYGIYAGFSPMQAAGNFTIGLQTRAEMTDGTLALIKHIVKDYLEKGPTAQEVAEAKMDITGSLPLSNASNGKIVGQLGMIGFYHLPLNYLDNFVKDIQAVTPEQIKVAMNKHLNVDDFIVVTVGPTVKQQPLPNPTETKPLVLGVPEH